MTEDKTILKRFKQMRSWSHFNGKYSPSMEELNSLLETIKDMICPVCLSKMHWSGRDGMAGVVTLQHDRESDKVRLMCGACNSHHNHLPGDTFYRIEPGTKLCPKCKEIKSVDNFCKDSAQASKLKSWCRPCSYASFKSWHSKSKQLMQPL